MKNKIIAFVVLIVLHKTTISQDMSGMFKDKAAQVENAPTNKWKNIKKFIEADLLNNRYYQALVKNGFLKQGNNEYQLKSTIYGLIRIFDSTKKEKTFFKKYTWARNATIGLGAVMGGSGENIDALNTSLAINIINGREIRASKLFDQAITLQKIDDATKVLEKVQKNVEKIINDRSATDEQKSAVLKQLDDFNKDNTNFKVLKGLVTDTELDECEKLWTALCKNYDDIQAKLNGAPSLIYKYEGNYANAGWQKLDHSIEFLVGLGNKKDSVRKYDFYAGIFHQTNQDSNNKASFLNRSQFIIKSGVNAVLLKDAEGNSTFEAFGGLEFVNTSQGRYDGEKENAFKLDLTLSVRLAKNLFLPFQIKYNDATGRFEGNIDLKMHIFNVFK